MRRELQHYPFKRTYEASNTDLAVDFYIPAMMRATEYDRAVGYFRSSIFHLVHIAISDFVQRNGKMRLICSPNLDPDDERTIRTALARADIVDQAIVEDILHTASEPKKLPILELLATMVTLGLLEIRIAYVSDRPGIFHTKVGIFRDDCGNAVSFDGSPNETFMAWAHNEERFRAHLSWKPGGTERIDEDAQYFNELWNGRRPSLVVKPLPEIAAEVLRAHSNPDPQEAVEKVRRNRRNIVSSARRPPKTLQRHQSQALTEWRKARSGLLDHVTGGGKTITALACIRDWILATPDSSVLVVVPTDLLTSQWSRDIDAELGDLDPHVLHVGGSMATAQWPAQLPDYLQRIRSRRPRLIIATMDSAASDAFMRYGALVSDATLVVVDEVHRVGSPTRQRILDTSPGARLGLSATPERYGDPDGTSAIFDYFGEILEPKFGIRDAQNCDPARLVNYSYHVEPFALSSTERERYDKLSKRIAMLTAMVRDESEQEYAESLQNAKLQRARLLKKASAKIPYATRVLRTHVREGTRWLVYCDDTDQIDQLEPRLLSEGITTLRYLSSMDSSKPETLEKFDSLGGVLFSVRCLDEGVDIPQVSHALILASSLNPREHLQRRGRVLRTAPGKPEATLFDALAGVEEPDGTIHVFEHEIDRARSFALDARNSSYVTWYLDSLDVESRAQWFDIESDDTEEQPDAT